VEETAHEKRLYDAQVAAGLIIPGSYSYGDGRGFTGSAEIAKVGALRTRRRALLPLPPPLLSLPSLPHPALFSTEYNTPCYPFLGL
jgi:hypothetical protein